MSHLSRILLLFSFLSVGYLAKAQLPAGTPAPAFTAVDIDGNTQDLYAILESGKHVILEFSATWCSICWSFHQSGTFDDLHEMYGPDGTDEIRVLFIESDDDTSPECLFGPTDCDGGTIGNWVADHQYDFIQITTENAPNIESDYAVAGYPTILAISANHQNGVYRIGHETNLNVWTSWFQESFEMSVEASATDIDCNSPTGSVTASVTNGSGNIAYEWSTGAVGPVIDGLDPGVYSVTVTDENGYAVADTVEVLIDVEVLEINTDQSSPSCNGDTDGSISIEVPNANGPLEIEWSNGVTNTTELSDLPAGNYSVTVTDQNGCVGTQDIALQDPEALALLNANLSDHDCVTGLIEIDFESQGGVAPLLYELVGEGITNSTGVFEVLPGQYTARVTDAQGCQSEDLNFDVPEVDLTPEASYDYEVIDGVLFLYSTSTGNPDLVQWSVGESGDTAQTSFSANGLYSVCVEVTNDCGMDEVCQFVDYVTAMEFVATETESFCAADGGSILINPEGGRPPYSIAWTGPNGFSSEELELTGLDEGVYSMQLMDDFGNERFGEFELSQFPEILASSPILTHPTGTLSNGSIDINISGGVGNLEFSWSNGASTESLVNVPAGEYSLSVRDEEGCEETFGPFTLNMTTSVDNIEGLNRFELAPNPVRDQLFISLAFAKRQNVQVQIFNAVGDEIFLEQFEGLEYNRTVHMGGHPQGVYFVGIRVDDHWSVQRFVLSR